MQLALVFVRSQFQIDEDRKPTFVLTHSLPFGDKILANSKLSQPFLDWYKLTSSPRSLGIVAIELKNKLRVMIYLVMPLELARTSSVNKYSSCVF